MEDKPPLLTQPLDPKAENGEVVSVNPPDAALRMTPDHADIAAIRLIDAAAKARGER
jgi:hypothetical protein